jgi:hypothetical protein
VHSYVDTYNHFCHCALTTHNIKYLKWYTISKPTSYLGLRFLNQITLQNYLLEIHHGWTLWFRSKRTTRPGANGSPIVSHLAIILQVFNQMWITTGKNLKLVLLCDPRNLDLLGALRAKPFAKWHFLHWWLKNPICQTRKHLSKINMVVPKVHPHNIHRRVARTMAKDGSIWPSTLGRWHGAQLCTWFFHV